MKLKDQIRQWLGGLWIDFWRVPIRHVLLLGVVVVWAVIEGVWKTWGALDSSVNLSYYACFPLRIGVTTVLLICLYRQFP